MANYKESLLGSYLLMTSLFAFTYRSAPLTHLGHIQIGRLYCIDTKTAGAISYPSLRNGQSSGSPLEGTVTY